MDDLLWNVGGTAVLVAFIALIFWLGARIAFVILGGLILVAAYLLGRAAAGAL